MRAVRAIAIVVVAIAAPHAVDAKALLVKTTPAANAVLQRGPDVLEFTFSEPVDMAQVELALKTTSGEVVSLGEPEAQPRFGTRVLRQVNQPLGGGIYTVSWRVVTSAGEPTSGSYRFTVQTAK